MDTPDGGEKEEETHAPSQAERQHDIQQLGRQARLAGIEGVVSVIQRGQQAPAAIDLRVVPVGLGDDQEDRREQQRDE